jgi:ribonuclease HI
MLLSQLAMHPDQVLIYTDGSCLGNPGPGGWACILECGEHRAELYGCDPNTTNNRMELEAVIQALRALTRSCTVQLVTDSVYVKDGLTKWIAGWKRKGWVTTDKKPVKNQELWQELDRLAGLHTIQWKWVKGHATDARNNRCDTLAQAAARKQIRSS